jgi:hypothetical protein
MKPSFSNLHADYLFLFIHFIIFIYICVFFFFLEYSEIFFQYKEGMGDRDTGPTIDAKVVLLGETGVGKTSLAMRFGQDIFSQRTVPTVGASFLTKVMYVPPLVPVD